MNAAKFIADKGWDLAQRDVVCLETGFITKADFLKHYGFEILDEMKIYVDAWELVNQFDDIEQAKAYLPEFDNDVPWNIKGGELRFFKWQLEEAITLVEEVESLKEEG